MELKVHLLQEYEELFVDNLKNLVNAGVRITCGKDLPDPPDYDILISGVPDRKNIESSPRLKRLIIPWAGLPQKTRLLMRDYSNISVHNIHHNAVPVAEMAVLMMLALAKNLISIDASFRSHDWSMRYENIDSQSLAGKTALILGYGAIGKEIASRCRTFDMEVTAINNRTIKESDGDVSVYPVSQLNALLRAADILFLSLPLTKKTKGILDADNLSLLPNGAMVINVSRGQIINEQALYKILKSRRIKAGLDVWYNYPDTVESRRNTPPSKYPFHELPNVVMTPHLAEHSSRIEVLRARDIARLLNLALEGKEIPNKVDLRRGY